MFKATYLGHHGWLFESTSGRLLVDPIFTDRFGFSDATELYAYPPRKIDVSAIGDLNAIFLTHEHEGHFEPASLNRLDRKTPILMSPHSSRAMRDALTHLGFAITIVRPGISIALGNLELLPLATDQTKGAIEEWDVLGYLVSDREGHGSFFSSVDMRPSADMLERVTRVTPNVGFWTYATNYHQFPFQMSWLPTDLGGLRDFVDFVVEHHSDLLEKNAAPSASLIVGGGWCFGGQIAWINRNAFPFENEDAARVLAQLLPEQRFSAPQPGDCLRMQHGAVIDAIDAPFVTRVDRRDWPSRELVNDVAWLERYAPACGRTSLSDRELDELVAELTGFAHALYGGDLFRQLLSLSDDELQGRRGTIALSLRDGDDGGAFVFAYDPSTCTFESVASEDPVAEYVVVLEAWSTDLLATFKVEMSQNAISFGRSREWNAIPEKIRGSVTHALFMHVHPLRFGDRFSRLYRTVIAQLPMRASSEAVAAE